MEKIILLLLCICILVTSFSQVGFSGEIRIREKQEPLKIDKKYDRLRGILIIGFSVYFSYIGYRMLQGADYEEGDVKLVGGLLLTSSLPLFIWGIKLTF